MEFNRQVVKRIYIPTITKRVRSHWIVDALAIGKENNQWEKVQCLMKYKRKREYLVAFESSYIFNIFTSLAPPFLFFHTYSHLTPTPLVYFLSKTVLSLEMTKLNFNRNDFYNSMFIVSYCSQKNWTSYKMR